MIARTKRDEPNQSRRFIAAARELGCDESEAALDEAIRRIGKAPPAKNTPRPKPSKPAK